MASIRIVRSRSKKKVLTRERQLKRREFEAMELDGRTAAIRSLIGIGLLHVYEELDREVVSLVGERYARKGKQVENRRHGSNPGSVRLAGQRIGIEVPRVRDQKGEVNLSSYKSFQNAGEWNEILFKRVLYGLSCRNYEAAAEVVPGAIGLSSSTVSRQFVAASAQRLKQFMTRDLSDLDIVALFLDGKTFASDELVLALGVTMDGCKVVLGFVQTATENSRAIKEFLGDLKGRGLSITQGVLVVIDGSKGFSVAVKDAFRGLVVVQRCQWHKRENVVGYLAKGEQVSWRRRLQRAYSRPTYSKAKGELTRLQGELETINQSAAASLIEGMEETLTLHRLGVYAKLGMSFKTTNCLESINAMVEQRCGKVKAWKNSNQKQRWYASALWDIEPRLHRVRGYRELQQLRAALIENLKITDTITMTKTA